MGEYNLANDMYIISGIVTMFILLGVLLPIIQHDMNMTGTTDINVDGFTSELGQDANNLS